MILVELARKPGTLTPSCKVAGAGVTIDRKFNELGQARMVEVDQTSGSKKVTVEFTLPDLRSDTQTVLVEAGEAKEVKCGEFK